MMFFTSFHITGLGVMPLPGLGNCRDVPALRVECAFPVHTDPSRALPLRPRPFHPRRPHSFAFNHPEPGGLWCLLTLGLVCVIIWVSLHLSDVLYCGCTGLTFTYNNIAHCCPACPNRSPLSSSNRKLWTVSYRRVL